MPDVFLSYAREDLARAGTVAAALEKAGLSVWWDERMSGGSEYSKEIEKALREADAVVVLWSAASVDSPWVRDEAAKGRDAGKLIPASLDGTEPPLGFGQFHTVDLAGRRRSAGLKQLVAATVGRIDAATSGNQRAAAERTPRITSERSRKLIATAGGAALVLVAAVFYLFASNPFGSRSMPDLARGTVAIGEFETLSNDPETRGLARLTTEAIERLFATNLIETVSARSASAAALERADFGLRGTIDRADNQAIVSATITDLKSGRTLWSTRLERTEQEARELPEQTAIWLADVLRCSSDTARRMSEHRSFQLLARILRYCDAVRGRQFEQLPKVAQSIVEVAPESSEAHAIRAFALALGLIEPDQKRGPVYAAARRALELDPKNGLARYAIAAVPNPALSIAERERMLRRAIELDPGFAWNKQQLAAWMLKVGRRDEARRLWTEFTGEYPLDYSQRIHLAYLIADMGDLQEARREFERVERLRPGLELNIYHAIRVETLFGDAAAANRWLERRDLTDEQRHCTMRIIDAVARSRAGGRSPDVGSCPSVFFLPMAQIAVVRGNIDDAFERLNASVENNAGLSWSGPHFVFERWAALLRADPRFMPLMARHGIAQYWLETDNWPEFCSRERLPYDCREAAKAAVDMLQG